MAKDPLAFQKDVMAIMQVHFPGALQGNVEANSRCAGELAMALGAVLAFAFRLNGEVIGRTVLQTMVHRIVENATAIDAKAGEIIRESLPKIIAPSTPTKQ